MKMILVMAMAAGSMLAQSAPATTTTVPPPVAKTKKTTKVAPQTPLTIPAGAVDKGDGSFRYVDKKGTAWIYRQTPFGVSRSLESSLQGNTVGQTPFGPSKSAAIAAVTPAHASPKALEDPDAKVTAVAKGDKIQFTRPTPFGVTKWEKNKSDLTTDEQKIWARLQPKGNQ